MRERPERFQSPVQDTRYVKALRDIRNMLYFGALGSLITPISYALITGEPQSPEVVMMKFTTGFSIGMFIGLPIGRLLRL